MPPEIRFNDGAGYERMMGTWSRSAGEIFLDWCAPAKGLRWVDVGCGNGAFTEVIVARTAPVEVHGIDPSEGQLAYARTRPGAGHATFQRGDAMALPLPDKSVDVAVMALVIFFVPDPVKGVAEMVRVTRPGGLVAAYAWDMLGGGFPLEPMFVEMRRLGTMPTPPPSAAASRLDAMRDLWSGAGLTSVETREITVQRTFADFEDYWTTSALSSSAGPAIGGMAAPDAAKLKAIMRDKLPADAAGRIICSARANAVKGRLPA